MRLEQRGRIRRLYSGLNWQQEETREYGKTIHHPETVGVRGLQGRESQRWRCRRGQGVHRGLRNGLAKQPVSNLESDVVGKLLPPAGESGGHSEEEWREPC